MYNKTVKSYGMVSSSGHISVAYTVVLPRHMYNIFVMPRNYLNFVLLSRLVNNFDS